MTPHLRSHVRAYVDRALPPPLLHVYDRHLVCCALCRSVADQERRIVASLRSDTGVPGSLRSSLIGLAMTAPLELTTPPPPRIPMPQLGRQTVIALREPVPTVAPTSPALHRSPMRAAVVASIAAGASVAAAWGLAISPLPGGSRLPSARVPSGVSSIGSVNATVGLAGVGLAPARTVLVSGTLSDSRSTSSRDPENRRRVTTSPTPVYWVVSSAAADVSRAAVAGPVRMSLVTSAQSGP